MGKQGKSSGLGNLVGIGLLVLGVGNGLRQRDRQDAADADAGLDAPGRVAAGPPATGIKAVMARIDRLQQRSRPLGFLYGVVKKFGDDQAGKLAALVAYYGFFSLFPLLLALSAILGFVLDDGSSLAQDIKGAAANQLPGGIGRDIVGGNLQGNVLAVVVGVALALWAGLAAMDAVTNAMNEVWDVPLRDRAGTAVRRARGLLMLVVVGLGLVASTTVANLAPKLPALPGVGRVGLVAGSIAINTLLYLASFRVLCDRKLRWGWLWPGALLAGLGSYVLQQVVGQTLINNNQSAEKQNIYGTFTLVIALLSWLFLMAQVTILAAEVNAVRARRLWPRSLVKGGLTSADRQALSDYAATEARVAGEHIQVEFRRA